MIEIIDTNIILRYLVGDDKDQYEKAKNIFKEGELGKRKIYIKAVVVAESCFVLESFYKKTKEEISVAMEVFISQKWLKVEDRKALLSMWPWFKGNLHFVDSYLLALSKAGNFKLVTFDEKLEKKSVTFGN